METSSVKSHITSNVLLSIKLLLKGAVSFITAEDPAMEVTVQAFPGMG